MLDQDGLAAFESRCLADHPPRCRAACPFDLDVRTFLFHLGRAEFEKARALLDRHLPLPSLLTLLCDHPCENVCLRADLGGALALQNLERVCLTEVSSTLRTLPLPPKHQRMAIVGSGLAALTAAWDLAAKAYPVTLFSAGDLKAPIL